MMKRVLMVFMGTLFLAAQAAAQQKTVTGKITSETGAPVPGVAVVVKGTSTGGSSNSDGNYSVRAAVGQVLQFRLLGNLPEERTVGADNVINVQLKKFATSLDAMVVTALGQTTSQRSLGVSQQTVMGSDVAATGRENFINGLQGRVAGVEVVSTSGVPGASSSITIRGVSSISSSNQPLMIIDGLPLDNKTLNTGVLGSDRPGSNTAFSNRNIDFTNRAADINPEDIESMVVLKGPEAAALYGIDAANGAIVITTKRGKPGAGGFEYSNRFRIDNTRAQPEIQQTYGPTSVAGNVLGSFSYFGNPYAPGTKFYNNVDGFFQQSLSQQHNVTFSGASPDSRVNYRVGLAANSQGSVIPNTDYTRYNLTGAAGAQVTSWLKTDLSMQYAAADNKQPLKGSNGPLINLLLWPQTDNAKDYLSPAGTRRRITALGTSTETDNPYFSLYRNLQSQRNNRLVANLGLVLTPFSWGYFKTNIGSDSYTNENVIKRDPESAAGFDNGGILDNATDVVRNLSAQTLFNVNRIDLGRGLSLTGLVGNQIIDQRSQVQGLVGNQFLDPNFVSLNNTTNRSTLTTLTQRRLVSAFGSATLSYNDYLFVTATGRNDWTSTIPVVRNSFFYPSVQGSFVFSDAIPSIGRFMTGKLRASYARVGKDARPYAYSPSLEYKTTSNGGYGYGFTGPNVNLGPEFARSYEYGTELSFFKDRLGIDVTTYNKETTNQIVNDIRGSYATGFILFNLNGASTRNTGLEATLRITPALTRNFSWDVLANFERARGKVLALPNALPESYVSDTWLYGNVRNGVTPGFSTRSLTGQFYLRTADKKSILIDPTSGLPLRSTAFVDGGYDRQPNFTIGLTNKFKYKKATLSFLVDIRRGGDVFNATEHFLTTRGLSNRTLDRDKPRVIAGVLRDGKENSATPTPNNIIVIPAVQTSYYTNISEELFIEKNINWVRLRDVTLSFPLPSKFLKARDASFYVTGTDLLLFTNYSGLDPIVNGNSAAVGGSGGVGIDFGNFPMPRGFAFGLKMGY